MAKKEALARVKIDRLLEESGWRFFDDDNGQANICLEPHVKVKKADLDALGDNFESEADGKGRRGKGFIDYLLLDDRGFPFIVLEAKSEDLNPLVGKEQARTYASSQNCRFIILSNGNLQYWWDLERGNPHVITVFPTPDSADAHRKVKPDPQRLVDESVDNDYIVLSQRPNYAADAAWKNEAERDGYIEANNLRFLRHYQLNAVHALQRAVMGGADRFLFEMATGTGKTLTAAAVIKLFLRTGNASRVLFLVDRLELEDQAERVFTRLLSADYTTVIYKERRDDWRSAEIVVSTVQSLLFNNKYRSLFSPTDFDLVISDEAHRSISGDARGVFEFFTGYKLGLTATPKDYLRGASNRKDPRELERRIMLDTYRTFGCESGEPTFRYSLLDGVRDGVLVNPTVVDARTDVTTQLLSEEGFVVSFTDEETGEETEESYGLHEYEKRFFSDETDRVFCETFLKHALRDPISNEVGKSIVFAVSQDHAARIAQVLNEVAEVMFPGRYHSDFAVQVTSQVHGAQDFTRQFSNNNLMGSANFMAAYKTSKARVCVTVGMMTTGYDCPDLLNLALFRPVFSPTEFVQIKGRGTRPHDFAREYIGGTLAGAVPAAKKTTFKLFDFFAVCEYFENEFAYGEVIELPPLRRPGDGGGDGPGEDGPVVYTGTYEHFGPDRLNILDVHQVGAEGMKIDRMLFDRFADTVRADHAVAEAVEAGQWDKVIAYVNEELFDKPEEYYTLDKLRAAAAVDRRLTLREILEKVFDLIPHFKSKDELLEEEFANFIAQHPPEDSAESVVPIKHFFKAYATDGWLRDAIDGRRFAILATHPAFNRDDYRAVPEEYRNLVPEYIKDYVSFNQFAA